ncbi:MAG: HAMP domain-containing protein [Halieaceae bacterium]|jgi:signal transduction histidine kinase|nr:HAMP domain-containing protein [Halieaceae bacterium]
MTLRGNLFVKVFIGFWLMSMAIVGSWLLTSHYFESLPEGPSRPIAEGPPRQFWLRLIYNLQNSSGEELPHILRKMRREHDIDIYLLNARGKDIFDRKLVPDIIRVASQLKGPRSKRAVESRLGNIVGHRIYRTDHGPLRAVAVFHPPKPSVINTLNQNLWLRIALAIIISGLACFVLSRAVTNRLKELQLASRRLANGDLSTRIEVRQRGGDETDELARDFNSMAVQLGDKIEAQKRLMGDVSHELRSPLARLRIALALTQDDPDHRTRHLARIGHEAERLEALIDQLLSSQAGDVTLDAHIDLVSLLDELCRDASFEGRACDKQVIFTTSLGQALVTSHADLLKKCFENILRNALKYTNEHSQIKVSLKYLEDHFIIHVEDHGPGVPELELDKIFEDFYRVDTARPRDTGGYGLGLAIAKRAVVLHRGRIEANNTGRGLAIVVTLPAHLE